LHEKICLITEYQIRNVCQFLEGVGAQDHLFKDQALLEEDLDGLRKAGLK